MTFCLFSLKRGLERAFFHFQEIWEQIWMKYSEVCSFLLQKTFTKFQTVSCSLCRIDWEVNSRLVRHFLFPLYIIKESEMMPMKKITFNAPLNHKAYSYEPMKIEVEKVIPLYGKRCKYSPFQNTPPRLFPSTYGQSWENQQYFEQIGWRTLWQWGRFSHPERLQSCG